MHKAILEKYKLYCEEQAQQLKVCPDIHPNDFIFQFLFENPSFQSKENAIQYYFNDGLKSAKKLSDLLTNICGFTENNNIRLLEFASGYGCVTRHLKNAIPFCVSTACDIHPEAIKFLQHNIVVKAELSAPRPEDLYLSPEFDVVFALSFFSHMPKVSFFRWLIKLASFVDPGGFLIFTTHGLKSRKFLSPDLKFDLDGFYYRSASEQKDINTEEYGLSCTTPQYVFRETAKIKEFTPVYFHEGYWWNHQDVYVLKNNKVSN
jgi:hypothetical protein